MTGMSLVLDSAVWLPPADQPRLTLYDAAYLELAQQLNLPLATLDQDLRKAAQAHGVVLLG